MDSDDLCAQDSKNILVVEDDADIRQAVKELLEIEGYSVSLASNGRAALELLSGDFEPRLIILDFVMPVMGGEEFLRKWKSSSQLSRIPILLMTASSEIQKSLALLGLIDGSMVAVERKPIEIDGFLQTVRAYF